MRFALHRLFVQRGATRFENQVHFLSLAIFEDGILVLYARATVVVWNTGCRRKLRSFNQKDLGKMCLGENFKVFKLLGLASSCFISFHICPMRSSFISSSFLARRHFSSSCLMSLFFWVTSLARALRISSVDWNRRKRQMRELEGKCRTRRF